MKRLPILGLLLAVSGCTASAQAPTVEPASETQQTRENIHRLYTDSGSFDTGPNDPTLGGLVGGSH